MIKKIDLYILKTFIGRFVAVFGILFFLFLMSFVFQKLGEFTGRGVSFFIIGKTIFYLGLSVVRMVLPLSILLCTIMSFGDLGEKYELAALKSSGISLWRIMRGLFIFSVICAVISFIFSDTIATDAYKKARNLQINILKSQADLAIQPGVFSNINGYPIRVSEKKGNLLKNIYLFIHPSVNKDLQIIIADRGTLINHDSLPLVELTLVDGYIYNDLFEGKSFKVSKRQEGNKIKFDTLIQRFNISKLLKESVITDDAGVHNHYQMLNTKELVEIIDTIDDDFNQFQNEFVERTKFELFSTDNRLIDSLSNLSFNKTEKILIEDFDLNREDSIQLISESISKIEHLSQNYFSNRSKEITSKQQLRNKYDLEKISRFVYAIECIMMFLIAASLGAIVRKGGIGVPLITGVSVFIIFFLLETEGKNWAIKGFIPTIIGASLPLIILLPFSIYLTIQANKDSEVLNLDQYLKYFRKIIPIFKKEKTHKRYQ